MILSRRHATPRLLLAALLCSSAAPASAQAVDTARVRALVRAGSAAWDAGDYKRAVVSWADAYALTGHAELLYRIGQAHEQLGNYQRAREYTEAYIQRAPGSPYAEAIHARINALAELERTQQPRIQIDSIPAGATIRVDGMEELVQTPAVIPCAAGEVIVELVHPAHATPLREALIAAPGATVRYKGRFERDPDQPQRIEEPKPAPRAPEQPKLPDPRPEQTPAPEPEPALTVVDIRPPTLVYILGWTGLMLGSAVGFGVMLVDYNNYGNELTPVWMGGLAVAGLSGYFMFGYDWAEDLPRVSANPRDAIPVARTINLTLEW